MRTGIARHGRLPWPTPADLGVAQRSLYDAIVSGPRANGPAAFHLTDAEGRLEGPFNAMLINPPLGGALQELGAAIRYRTSLPDRCREIAILTLARERASAFEWYAHAGVARQLAMTGAELDALAGDRDCDTFTSPERLVRRAVRALCRDRDLDDDMYAALADALPLEQVEELVTLVGYYDLLALSLRVWRTPLPEDVDAHEVPFAVPPGPC